MELDHLSGDYVCPLTGRRSKSGNIFDHDEMTQRFKDDKLADKRKSKFANLISNKAPKDSGATEQDTSVEDNTYTTQKTKVLINNVYVTDYNDIFKKIKADSEHIHYVNLPGNGPTLRISVNTNNMIGKEIYFKVISDSNNSKRTEIDKTLFKGINETNKKVKGFVKNISRVSTSVDIHGKAEIELNCGLAGGDEFTIQIGTKYDECLFEFTSVNWRKVWFQLAHLKGMKFYDENKIDLTKVLNIFNENFIELVQLKIVEFSKETFKHPSKIICTKEDFILECKVDEECLDNDRDYVILSNTQYTNSEYMKMFGTPKNIPIYFNMIIGDELRDQKYHSDTMGVRYKSAYRDDKKIKTEFDVFPDVAENGVTIDYEESSWVLRKESLNTDTKINTYKFTKDTLYIDPNRESLKEIKFELPEDIVNLLPEDYDEEINNGFGNGYYVELEVFYNGLSDTDQGSAEVDLKLLKIRYLPKNEQDFYNTITHEIGHFFNLVPSEGEVTNGIENHPFYYNNSGGHCSAVKNTNGDFKKGPRAYIDDEGIEHYEDGGLCIMFDRTDVECINDFCDVCKEHLKANSIIKIK